MAGLYHNEALHIPTIYVAALGKMGNHSGYELLFNVLFYYQKRVLAFNQGYLIDCGLVLEFYFLPSLND
jgi:hypothetical protein